MRNHRVLFLMLVFTVILLAPRPARAAVYKYTDREGREFYVDRLEHVPPEYRNSAVNVEERLQKAALTVEPGKPPKAAEEVIAGKKEDLLMFLERFNSDLVKSRRVQAGVIAGTLLVICIALFSLRNIIGPRKVGFMFVVIVGLMAFLFVYHTYIKGVVDAYTVLRDRAVEIRKGAEERNRFLEQIGRESTGKTPAGTTAGERKGRGPWQQNRR